MMIHTSPDNIKALRASVVKIGGRDFGSQEPSTKTYLSIRAADLKGSISSISMILDMGAAGDEIAQAIVDAIENHPGKGSADDAKAKADA